MANKLQRPGFRLRNSQVHTAAHSRKLHHTRRFHFITCASLHYNNRGIYRIAQDNIKRQRPRNPSGPPDRTESPIGLPDSGPHSRLRASKLLPTHPPPLWPRLRNPNNQHPKRHTNHSDSPQNPSLTARRVPGKAGRNFNCPAALPPPFTKIKPRQ